MSRDADNRDFIKGVNYPRQSYALSGAQWGDSQPLPIRGKKPTNGPPMIITPQPPGSFAFADDTWKMTFGASQDAFLSLINGAKIEENNVDYTVDYFDSFDITPSVFSLNLYKLAKGQQQVQYVVSKDTVAEAAAATKFGTTEEVRSIGLRAPAQMAGWGYTIGGRPTDPNPLNKRKNDDEHKLDRATWEVGPVDLRWDGNRKVWRGWNDLIADHRGGVNQGSAAIGTFVHGTCSSDTHGFPFQRGKLEDVWWVRTTQAGIAAYGNGDDYTKTAEVCTSLAHKLFDPGRFGAAPLWDVFIIHNGNPVSCGGETTLIGQTGSTPPPDGVEGAGASLATLEIRTTAIYHYSDALAGPINFTQVDPDTDEFVGSMKLVDGQWCPVVPFDFESPTLNLCANALYAAHMSRLTRNSEAVIIDGVFDLQSMICTWNEEYTECILKHFAWTASNAGSAIWALNFLVPAWITLVANEIMSTLIKVIVGGLTAVQNNLMAVINSLVTQIQLCFAALELGSCPIELAPPPTPVLETPVPEIPNLDVPGFVPPNCLIKSFAAWQFNTGRELDITIVNPCLGPTDFRASCFDFGTDEGGGVGGLTEGESFGGTDGDGDVNIGGSSFGDPSTPGGDPSGQTPPD